MAYKMLTLLTPLLTSPILARALGAEKIGIYSATLAIINVFMLVAMLGSESYGSRTIGAFRNDRNAIQRHFWNIYAVQFVAGCLSVSAYLISCLLIEPDRRLFALLQTPFLLSCLLDINWFYYGCEEFKITVLRNTILKLVTIVCIVLFIHGPDDLWKYIIIMSCTTMISQLMLWVSLRKFIFFEKPQLKEARQHVRPMLNLFIPTIATSVFFVMDKLMIDFFSIETQLGYYYSADKIISIPFGIILALDTIMLPRMANIFSTENLKNAETMLKKTSELTMFFTTAMGFGIAAIAKEFVPFFFGPGFEPCIVLIYLFVPVIIVKGGTHLIRYHYLIPIGKDRIYSVSLYCGVVANLIANFFLIRKYAAIGAVLGTIFAEVVVLIVEIIGTRKEVPFTRMLFSHSLYILFGALMYLAVRWFSGFLIMERLLKLIVMILFGAIIFLTLCLVWWFVLKKGLFYDYIAKLINKNFCKHKV